MPPDVHPHGTGQPSTSRDLANGISAFKFSENGDRKSDTNVADFGKNGRAPETQDG